MKFLSNKSEEAQLSESLRRHIERIQRIFDISYEVVLTSSKKLFIISKIVYLD